MKIFRWPQYSMRSYETGKWLMARDGHFVRIRAIAAATPDWDWTFAVPSESHINVNPPANVDLMPFPWMDNVQAGRYYMPLPELIDHLKATQPDIFFCDVPELVENVRIALVRAKLDIPIVSFLLHYGGTAHTVGQGALLRQLEGYLGSDLMGFPLRSIADAFATDLRRTFVKQPSTAKFRLWTAAWSPAELLAGYEPGPKDTSQRVIFFISRLSDDRRTRYEAFLTAIDMLAKKRHDFQLWIANPNEALSWADVRAKLPWWPGNPWGFQPTRAAYLAALWWADIVPILYPVERVLSIGCFEAAYAENAIVTPGLDEEPWDAFQIAAGLERALDATDETLAEEHAERRRWVMENYSVEQNIGELVSDLESL